MPLIASDDVLRGNLLDNSGFGVWSNGTLADYTDANMGFSDLVTNGGFDTDTTGWTADNTTLASVTGGQSGNCLELTATAGTGQYAYQDVTTEVGKLYRLKAYVKSGTSGDEAFRIRAYDNDAGVILGDKMEISMLKES
jgi:hypothetical protein